MSDQEIIASQRYFCEEKGIQFFTCDLNFKVGISENVRSGMVPINGVRGDPVGDTTGWYIWAGEKMSDDPDFFKPLHARHLKEWCPQILKFLGMPPGWRFLVAGDYEDVWLDLEALKYMDKPV